MTKQHKKLRIITAIFKVNHDNVYVAICHFEQSEESGILHQILHFAQNDKFKVIPEWSLFFTLNTFITKICNTFMPRFHRK